MKALSINSGYAALIAAGEKTIECRTWTTNHRGEILICANKDIVPGAISGHAISICNLKNVRPFTKKDINSACLMPDDYQHGLYAWELEPVCSVIPIPIRGLPGLFDVDEQLIQRINEEKMTDSEIEEIINKYFIPLVAV